MHLFHGAYANAYTYRGGIFYNGETHVKASSGNSARMQFEQMTFDTAGKYDNAVQIEGSPIPNKLFPNLFRECNFKNYKLFSHRDRVKLKGYYFISTIIGLNIPILLFEKLKKYLYTVAKS
ncbi:MAG: hypothetical protein EOO93_29150 [Pedobacter sp.]|nr:MAG: hypothetical protein EOO93_29150 [Pedobacter sp.]